MDKEAAILRRDLGRAETGLGGRYPQELRARVVNWAHRRHATGVSWEEIKRELGQRSDTVRRWYVEGGSAKALVPVRVIAPAAPARVLSVVSWAGLRIDGLTPSEAAALLREFG